MARTFNLKLIFCKNSKDNIVEYLHLNYIRLINGRKSTKVYIFIFASRPISHFLKLQPIVSLSSCKIEYMTLIKMTKKAI